MISLRSVMTQRVRRSGRSKLLPLYEAHARKCSISFWIASTNGALVADVVEQVLPEHQLALAEVGDAEEEDVRPRTTRETGGLRIQPKDVLPAARRLRL